MGEGIDYALRSGKFAGETAIFAHENKDFSQDLLSTYQRKCEDDFGSNLKYSLIFSSLFHRYPDMSARLMATNAPVLDKFVHLTTGELDYLSFMKWLIPRLPYYALKSFFGKY